MTSGVLTIRRAARRTVFAGVLLAVACPLWAAQTSSDAVPMEGLPVVLQSLVKSGNVEVLRQFPTEVSGITGYAVRHDGRDEVVFGSQGNLFVGQLISAKGENLTEVYSERFLPKPDYSAVAKDLDQPRRAIAEGHSGVPTLYAFVDPDCIFCYHLFNATRKPVAAGKLQMKWVLVGFLKSSSMARAESILDARDPLAVLRTNYEKFDPSREEGGAAQAKGASAATTDVLKSNFAAMRGLGSGGTPTLLYRGADNKWAMHVGFPSQAWLTAYEQGKALPAN